MSHIPWQPATALSAGPRPVFRWPEAGKALESVGKREGIHITDITRNGLDFLLGGHELVRRLGDSHRGQLPAWTAPKVFPAQATQMFWADIGQAGQIFKAPWPANVDEDRLPHIIQPGLPLPRINHASHVTFDNVDPCSAGARIRCTLHFARKPQHSVFKRTSVESRQPRSHGPRQRPRRCGHKAYPTELPPLIRCAMKGMQYMCRCEAGYALGMLMPSTVKQSLPLSAQAYLHEGAAQV